MIFLVCIELSVILKQLAILLSMQISTIWYYYAKIYQARNCSGVNLNFELDTSTLKGHSESQSTDVCVYSNMHTVLVDSETADFAPDRTEYYEKTLGGDFLFWA